MIAALQREGEAPVEPPQGFTLLCCIVPPGTLRSLSRPARRVASSTTTAVDSMRTLHLVRSAGLSLFHKNRPKVAAIRRCARIGTADASISLPYVSGSQRFAGAPRAVELQRAPERSGRAVMLRKSWLALAAVAAIGLGIGAASSAQAEHGHGGHHGGHHGSRHDYHHDHHYDHHRHHAGYGYRGYGFGYSGPTVVRSFYGPTYPSSYYYGSGYGGYGDHGRGGYGGCNGPSYGRGGVSVSIGF